MGLKEIRTGRNLSQRALAEISGVNYRSLQDYEQGHKQLASASGDVLLRLSAALGCTIPELLIVGSSGAPLITSNTLNPIVIQNYRFYCKRFGVYGQWVCTDGTVYVLFYYRGKQHLLPFHACFTPVLLPFLADAAVMMMEAEIERVQDAGKSFEEW